MIGQWAEIAHYTVPLYAFLEQTRLGQQHGLFVYYITNDDTCVYVGQTYAGVRLRLWRHVSQPTPLGSWMFQNEFTDPQPTCGIVKVSSELDIAERYYISSFNPTLNIIQYKTSNIFPPTDRCVIREIQLERRGYAQHGAITGLRSDGVWAGQNIIPELPAPDSGEIDRIYEKAYRDPNHPDFRPS